MPKGFQKGNKGKPKGVKNKKTLQWEALSESIIDNHSGRFNQILSKLFDSDDEKQQQRAIDAYLQILEYFKPKQSRVEATVDNKVNISSIKFEDA